MPPKILPTPTSQDEEDFQKALDEHEQLASIDVPASSHNEWDIDQLIPPEPIHSAPANISVPANIRERVYPEPPAPGSESNEPLPISAAAVKRTIVDQPSVPMHDVMMQPIPKKTMPPVDPVNIEHFAQLKTRERNITYKLRLAEQAEQPNETKISRFKAQLKQTEALLKNIAGASARSLSMHRLTYGTNVNRIWNKKDKDWVLLPADLKNHPLKGEIAREQTSIRSLKHKMIKFPNKYDTPVYRLKLASLEKNVQENIDQIKALSVKTSERGLPVYPKADDIDIDQMIDMYLKEDTPKSDDDTIASSTEVEKTEKTPSPLSFSDTDDDEQDDQSKTKRLTKRQKAAIKTNNDRSRWIINNVLSKREKELWEDRHYTESRISNIRQYLRNPELSQQKRDALEEELRQKIPQSKHLQALTKGFLSMPRVMAKYPNLDIPPEYRPKTGLKLKQHRIIDRTSGKFANVDLLPFNDPLMVELREAKQKRKNIVARMAVRPSSTEYPKTLKKVQKRIETLIQQISDKNEALRAKQVYGDKESEKIKPADIQSTQSSGVQSIESIDIPQLSPPFPDEENSTDNESNIDPDHNPLDDFFELDLDKL